MAVRWAASLSGLLCAAALFAQAPPEPTPPPPAAHDISDVDEAPPGGAIATPLPQAQQRRLRKYEIPELTGAKQALGSQLIDGRLPKPLIDYAVRDAKVDQRISLFEGGLVVVKMSGAGGNIRKRVIIPPDALSIYRKNASVETLTRVAPNDVSAPAGGRRAQLRIYADHGYVERLFDPLGAIPKPLHDQIRPLEDLLRAISEDRTVTSTVANYEPKVGDELVGDDRKTYRVERIIAESGIVELRCIGQPTRIYVAKKDLYNYFIGARGNDER